VLRPALVPDAGAAGSTKLRLGTSESSDRLQEGKQNRRREGFAKIRKTSMVFVGGISFSGLF